MEVIVLSLRLHATVPNVYAPMPSMQVCVCAARAWMIEAQRWRVRNRIPLGQGPVWACGPAAVFMVRN